MGLKQKLTEQMHKYVQNVILPTCYIVYRQLMNDHKVVDSDTFNMLILEELKIPQGEKA